MSLHLYHGPSTPPYFNLNHTTTATRSRAAGREMYSENNSTGEPEQRCILTRPVLCSCVFNTLQKVSHFNFFIDPPPMKICNLVKKNIWWFFFLWAKETVESWLSVWLKNEAKNCSSSNGHLRLAPKKSNWAFTPQKYSVSMTDSKNVDSESEASIRHINPISLQNHQLSLLWQCRQMSEICPKLFDCQCRQLMALPWKYVTL